MSEISKIVTLDIDSETGDIVLGGISTGGESVVFFIPVNAPSSGEAIQLSNESEQIKALAIQQETRPFLNFFYETYPISSGYIDFPFSIDVSDFKQTTATPEFDIDSFLLLNRVQSTSDASIYIPQTKTVRPAEDGNSVVQFDIWTNDASGISDISVTPLFGGFYGTSVDKDTAILLPVFSWNEQITKRYPRLLLTDAQGNIESYLFDVTLTEGTRASAVTLESQISSEKNPLESKQESEVVGGVEAQHAFVSDSKAFVEMKTDNLAVASYYKNESGAAIKHISPDGTAWAISADTGDIYKLVAVEQDVDVDQIIEDYRNQTYRERESLSSQSTLSSQSSYVVKSSSQSTLSSSISSISSSSTSSVSSASTVSQSSISSDYAGLSFIEIASCAGISSRIMPGRFDSQTFDVCTIELSSSTIIRKARFNYSLSTSGNITLTFRPVVQALSGNQWVTILSGDSYKGGVYYDSLADLPDVVVPIAGRYPSSGTATLANPNNQTAYKKYKLVITCSASYRYFQQTPKYTINSRIGISH